MRAVPRSPPSSATPGANGADVKLVVTVPPQKAGAALDPSGFGFGAKAPVALAALLLPLAAWRRRQALGKLMLVLVLGLVASVALVGCSPGGYFAQPTGRYTITVVGTSECGGIVHNSAPFVLTVSEAAGNR